MEFIDRFQGDKYTYTKNIKDSIYFEGKDLIQKKKGVNDICEIVIGNNEIEYSAVEGNHKPQYIIQKKLEIASEVVKDSNFIRTFNVLLIQSGLQKENVLSSILYLNHHYKIHCVIYNQDTNKYYRTTFKKYPVLVCGYKDDGWFELNQEVPDDVNYSDIQELEHIIEVDTDWKVYKPYLQVLSKYKLSDLEKIANENDISIKSVSGKKKLKKELYDDINLKYFQQDI